MTEAVKRTETTPVHSAAKQALPDTEIEPLSSAVRTAVVGADGFVGGALAEALGGKRVVYGPACDEDVHVSRAENVIREADVVINAGGFRLRPGCARADYQRSHQGATSAIVPWVRKGALVVHVSSAAVLGKSRTHKLGSLTPPHPQSFPSAHYALAKIEADQYLEREAAERGFRVIFLRPATVYSPLGAGMVGTVLRLAKKGINLRLYPRGARHHLCHMDLLVEVARRVVERRQQLPHRSTFIIADPYTVTNRELDEMIRRYSPGPLLTLPVPVQMLSAVLSRTFHSRIPRLDLKTWGEIFGVLNLDSAYDPFDTFRLLDIDPARYTLEKTLLPLVQQALQK